MERDSASDTSSCSCGRICEEYIQEARIIQASLIPSHPLIGKSVEIAYRFIPVFQVGGDFLDFFRLPDGTIGIYMGDVVGKGLPATMYGTVVMGTLRGIHKTGTETANVLSMLNERLMQRPLPGRFCSTLYALFNPEARTLTLSNAGLPYPLCASAEHCRSLGNGGIPSGLFPSVTYDQHVVQLHPGDTLLFATDGLHESCDPDGVEFCTRRLLEVWRESYGMSPDESLENLFASLRDFSHGMPPQDDITAVALKVLS
jgi:serine phosphatase RsbU (regulator of sigma subunit)